MGKVRIAVPSGRDVAERWHQQYFQDGRWITAHAPGTHEKLIALGEHPALDDIDAVIGNRSWTHLICAGCGNAVRIAAEFPRHDDPLLICRPCLREGTIALDMAARQ